MKLLTHLQRGPDDDDRSHGRHNIVRWDSLRLVAQQSFLLGLPLHQSGGVHRVVRVCLFCRGDNLVTYVTSLQEDLQSLTSSPSSLMVTFTWPVSLFLCGMNLPNLSPLCVAFWE